MIMTERSLTALLKARERLPKISTSKGQLAIIPPRSTALATATAQSTPLSFDEPERAVIAAICSETQRSFVVQFRRNRIDNKFYCEAVRTRSPEDASIPESSIALSDLPLDRARCAHCRGRLEANGCRYGARLRCVTRSNHCPGWCHGV